MAEAPGHKLGQIIGDALELSLAPVLQSFADQHSLFLDRKGPRAGRPRNQVLCIWTDDLGNSHSLDFVLERGGAPDKIGVPAAFIETAWRRYTKHSRAKAQEIQGAILPLLAKHANVKPFAGAVIAGRFTPGALQQLRSSGFSVLHIGYEEIVQVFAEAGIDVDTDEGTSDEYLERQVAAWDALSDKEKMAIGAALRKCAPAAFREFRSELERVMVRAVDRVTVLALHGTARECGSVQEAISVIQAYVVPDVATPLVRFEVTIRYTNGDRIDAQFASGTDAVAFLQTFAQ